MQFEIINKTKMLHQSLNFQADALTLTFIFLYGLFVKIKMRGFVMSW